MAPSRRKGANKSTAAAARLKWKIGDLVLAKVKGFPAWPATVSEPQKWGYHAVLKKVLVYFFGTKQIAFCNPADVEEFTEEKKVSLLGKRHGKSSDFVRALNEIIDCFEKLKKQNQVTSDDITEETNITNENNSDESLTKSVNDEAPVVSVKQISSGTINDLNSLTEAAVAAAAEEDLHDEEMQVEEANSNSVFVETHAYSTRSKTDATQSLKVGGQRRISSRKLSSSRIDASRHQNLMLPSINIRSSRQVGGNLLHDSALRRSKRIMKSSDDSVGYDASSHAFVCNDGNEDNGSEIMTVDSDTLSLNDGSTADSGCKSGRKEPLDDINDGETDLSDRFDFQTHAIIIKKKRKPNRKRQRNNIVPVDKQDEAVPEAEVLKTESISPGNNEKMADKYVKGNGDEHLPLLKRTRVRMGSLSPAVDEEGTLLHGEGKTTEVPESLAMRSSGSLSCKLDSPADEESVPTRGASDNSPLLQASPGRKPQYKETRKNFLDVEAALPPSKRLHRALEAMSANVAEDSQITSSLTSRCFSSSMECSEFSQGNKAGIELGSGQMEDRRNDEYELSASELFEGPNMEMPGNDGKNCAVLSDCGKISCGINSTNPELCKDSSGHMEGAESKSLKLPPSNDCSAEAAGEHQQINQDSTNIDEDLSHFKSTTPCLISSPDGGKIERSELEVVAERSDPGGSRLHLDSMLVGKIADGSLDIDSGAVVGGANGEGAETDKMKHPSLSENNQNSKSQHISRSEFVNEARSPSADSNIVPSDTSAKVLTSDNCGNPLNLKPLSDDCLDVRIVSVSQCSSYHTDGPDSVSRAPPPSSACKTSASDNNGCIEQNSSSIPDVQMQIEKAKLAVRSNGKLESLSSFEAIIRSLTRTKESIGRATRIAIDCANFGFATKVVETLAHNLESESSPPKKVDLFFLVDSITQCSGGMKGDAGIYPSAIQALLPRLLLAAAPPGTSFFENHRQCLKVLRVWLERKILPESIIRHHIRELDARYGAHLVGSSSRSFRFERPFDDPIREMEGMLVDEYGSNSSIQLPGFCMPPMLKDDDVGSDSDGESFEAVTPEHHIEHPDGENALITAVEKRSHILQDVDGELEMEDVAPSFEGKITSSSNVGGSGCTEMSHLSDNRYGLAYVSQQLENAQPMSTPIPMSPPPPSSPASWLHPLPPSVLPPTVLSSVSNGPDSKHWKSQEPRARQSVLPRVKPRTLDAMDHRAHDNKDSKAQLPRQMSDCNNACPFSDQPSYRASNRLQQVGGKGFHLRPPHPAPSNQFSYVREQRIQSRRSILPPSHPNRFYTRTSEKGNFYRYRDRNKPAPRDHIGEYWRPPLPSISGPCYHDNTRMAHSPMSYGGPPRDPALPSNRWNFPNRYMNHRQFNPYKPPSEGPIPVTNRGPNIWKTR